MKHLKWMAPLVLLMSQSLAIADSVIGYRPGYFRLAIEAAFIGRVHVDTSAPVSDADPECGVLYEATVSESLSGAPSGTKLRFVSDPMLRDTVKDGDAFAVLFRHALTKSDSPACWRNAAPLFAASQPASVIPFDQQGGQTLGGEFLPVGPENMLSGLQFSAIEIVVDGKNRRFASWELVRAYARQESAVRKVGSKSMPKYPSDPVPPPR